MKKTYSDSSIDCIELFRKNKGKPFKILLGFYQGELLTLLKSTFLLAIQESPQWVIPIVTANIINIATSPDEHRLWEIFINALILSVFILQNVFSTYGVSRVYDRLVRKTEYNLRSNMMQKLQHLSIQYHKNTSVGKLQSKIMRDCENIATMLASIFRVLVMGILTTSIIITTTAIKNPLVIVFFLFFVPVEVIFLRSMRSKISNRNSSFRHELETTQSKVSETLSLVPVTRAHGLQDYEIGKMNSQFTNVKNAGYSLDKTNAFFGAGLYVLMQMSQLSCLLFTGTLAYKGMLAVGDIALFQSYFAQLVSWTTNIVNIYPQLAKGLESINSIGEIIAEDDIEPNNSIIPLDGIDGGVEFKNVFYKYPDGDKWILNDFSLKVAPGESIAFVGGSGAGKSTILNLLIGFFQPNDGDILIDRINIQNLDMREFRHHIAVVPQNTILFSGTLRDNITYGTEGVTDEQLEKALRDVGLDELVRDLPHGLDTYLGENGGKLSGGQRQRISIARALLRNPKIIIFDEATSALDSESEKKVQLAVDNMMKHCTTFLVAHRLSTIKNADRIAVLSRGKITEIGSHDELMAKKGDYYKLKTLQE